jgi:hypothetical protein
MQLPDVDFEFNDTGLYITVNGVKIAAGSPKIGRTSAEKHWRSCTSLPFASCCEGFVIPYNVSGRTLSNLAIRAVYRFVYRNKKAPPGPSRAAGLFTALYLKG